MLDLALETHVGLSISVEITTDELSSHLTAVKWRHI